MSESAALFRRDRVILGAGLLAVALLAWAWLIAEAHRMNVSGVCECMRMKMTGPDNSAWPAATPPAAFSDVVRDDGRDDVADRAADGADVRRRHAKSAASRATVRPDGDFRFRLSRNLDRL